MFTAFFSNVKRTSIALLLGDVAVSRMLICDASGGKETETPKSVSDGAPVGSGDGGCACCLAVAGAFVNLRCCDDLARKGNGFSADDKGRPRCDGSKSSKRSPSSSVASRLSGGAAAASFAAAGNLAFDADLKRRDPECVGSRYP